MKKIKCKLERCPVRFTPTRKNHVFHSDACRAEYRRTHTPGTGTIKSLRQLKSGDLSITIHTSQQMQLQVGSKIVLSRD